MELAKLNLQIALSLGTLEEDAKLRVSPATVHIWCTIFCFGFVIEKAIGFVQCELASTLLTPSFLLAHS